MAYTKGEWAVIEDDATFQVYVPSKSTVAKIHKRWGDDGKANAQLISASPDMYEALKAITSQFSKVDKLYYKDNEIISQAEQALAKAEA